MKKKDTFINFNYIKFKSRILLNDLSYFFYNIQRKNLKLFKFFDQRKIGSIPRILLSSIIIVSFFYIAPILSNYEKKFFFSLSISLESFSININFLNFFL